MNVVVLAVVHESVDAPPAAGSEVGEDVSVHDGAAGAAVTVTVTAHVAFVVPVPVTVPVYVVVTVGDTDFEPAATGVTTPTLWSILKATPFEVVHESVDEPPPTGSVAGLAVSVQVGAGGEFATETVAEQVAVPPVPVTVIVYVVLVFERTDVEPAETGVASPTP